MSEQQPRISLIAAMAENRAIGIDNRLPWRLPADLQHFKRLTVGKPIIMGRNTWESLPGLLPDRLHIVLTRNSGYSADNCQVVTSIDDALAAAGAVEEVMIVGGATIYEAFLPLAQRLYLTLVHSKVEGDTFFPPFNEAEWTITEREDHQPDEKNSLAYSFLTYSRS